MDGRESSRTTSEAAQRALDRMRTSPVSRRPTWRSASELVALRAAFLKSGRIRVAVVVVGVVLSALFAAVWFVSRSPSTDVQWSPAASTIPAASIPTTTGPGVVVDVGGAVRQPGVYRLPIGARVVDALEIAGGPTDAIDLDQLNLAATVVDGQRVWITRRGEASPAIASSVSGGAGGVSITGPLDLNSATIEQLDSLTGIGPSTAKAIIDRRTELGRFRSVDDLLTVKGIGSSKLDGIRKSVVVR